jgi:hypothetical protein
MTLNRWKARITACAVLLFTPFAMGTAPLQVSFDQRILAAHNQERLSLGLEPLSWNPALVQTAQQWADYLAATGRFEHAPENRYQPEGENLWAGTKGFYAPEAMVDAWVREKKYFRPGLFPDNSTTGKMEDVGHYTQLVWAATHEVGCAQAKSASEDILVCRYAEAGNYRGEQPFRASDQHLVKMVEEAVPRAPVTIRISPKDSEKKNPENAAPSALNVEFCAFPALRSKATFVVADLWGSAAYLELLCRQPSPPSRLWFQSL